MLIGDLIKETRNSSFNMTNYEVTIPFHRFIQSISLHTNYETCDDIPSDNYIWLKSCTPDFQRDNNKWNLKMKQKFIENVLKGANTEILLFKLNDEMDAKIIDGLQRTTAIIDFFENKFSVFGYLYKDLKKELSKFSTHIYIKIYTFRTMNEVGRFYIDMNENITHSSEDIQKCIDYFKLELNIIL